MAVGNGSAALRTVQAEADATLKKVETGADLVAQFYQDMAKQREAAQKIQNPEERSTKLKLIDAKIADLRKEEAVDTGNIAKVVGSVLAKEQELDSEFDTLSNRDNAQKAEVKEKEDAVKTAEGAVESAKTQFNWFGLANYEQSAADALAQAKAELQRTETRINQEIRDRVLKADFQTSINTLQLRMERSVRALEKHHGVLSIEYGVINKSKEASFEAARKATEEKIGLDKDLDALQRDLTAETSKLASILDEAKRKEAERRIADLKMRVELTTNLRNSALGVEMEESKNATDYSGMEVSTLQEMGTMKNLIDIMKVKVENLPKMRSHYVKIMQGGAIVEIGKTLLQVGDKGADTMAERITRMGQASVNARQEYYKTQPDELAKKVERRQAQEAAQVENLKQDAAIAKAFEEAGVNMDRIFTNRGDDTAQPSA